jgi:FlgN protein
MALRDLSGVLWRMRELLELLLFKLEEEQLLLAAGRSRWLAHATHEVEVVLERLREAEIVRAMHADAAAATLGLPPGSGLAELAGAAPEPWCHLLRQHREAFTTLMSEIAGLATVNRELLSTGLRAVRETVFAVVGSAGTYGSRGEAVAAARRAHLVDEAI